MTPSFFVPQEIAPNIHQNPGGNRHAVETSERRFLDRLLFHARPQRQDEGGLRFRPDPVPTVCWRGFEPSLVERRHCRGLGRPSPKTGLRARFDQAENGRIESVLFVLGAKGPLATIAVLASEVELWENRTAPSHSNRERNALTARAITEAVLDIRRKFQEARAFRTR